jgi:hypothetical protein
VELEPVVFAVELRNPLQVPITLKKTFLVCQYSVESKISNQASWTSVSGIPEGFDPGNVSATTTEYDAPIVDEFVISPLTTRKLTLNLIPKKKGFLRILGFHTIVFDSIPNLIMIDKKGKRLNTKKEERMAVIYAQDTSLELIITSPMPLLDVSFHNLPSSLASGEVRKCILEVVNRGKIGLKNLLCKVSDPSIVHFGNYQALEIDIYQIHDKGSRDSEHCSVPNKISDISVTKIPLPSYSMDNLSEVKTQVSFLPPGNTALIPVWFKGDRVGSCTLRFLFRYESIVSSPV